LMSWWKRRCRSTHKHQQGLNLTYYGITDLMSLFYSISIVLVPTLENVSIVSHFSNLIFSFLGEVSSLLGVAWPRDQEDRIRVSLWNQVISFLFSLSTCFASFSLCLYLFCFRSVFVFFLVFILVIGLLCSILSKKKRGSNQKMSFGLKQVCNTCVSRQHIKTYHN
jgi:hypothetical protein